LYREQHLMKIGVQKCSSVRLTGWLLSHWSIGKKIAGQEILTSSIAVVRKHYAQLHIDISTIKGHSK